MTRLTHFMLCLHVWYRCIIDFCNLMKHFKKSQRKLNHWEDSDATVAGTIWTQASTLGWTSQLPCVPLRGRWDGGRADPLITTVLSPSWLNPCSEAVGGLATGSVDSKYGDKINTLLILIDIWESKYSKILTGKKPRWLGVWVSPVKSFQCCSMFEFFTIKG